MVREGVQHFKMTCLLLTKMFSFTVENFKIYESKNFNYDAVTYWKRNEQVRTWPKMKNVRVISSATIEICTMLIIAFSHSIL